jgi:phage shock protein C
MTLYRSSSDIIIAGVCGGIAEALGWDPTKVRIACVLLLLLSGIVPGILVYLVLWFVMPQPPS